MLLKRSPDDPAPAEEAYRVAIGVAKQQGARSYELLGSLSLARLYKATSRPADAPAVLAPALEGFSPAPEMPEIAEAQALLAVLTETDEVKAEAERRQRRQHLQVSYGNALIAARGFGAAETQKPLQEPATRPTAKRTRPSAWPPTSVYGLAATPAA